VVALNAHRRTGAVWLIAGLAWVALVQVAAPAYGPPLYDGVVVVDPYRWLSPPPGRPGGAQGASSEVPVIDRKSPLVAIATPEQPPQAQIFAAPDAFPLPPGTKSVHVSITPIPAEGAPADGHIAGNVYRITVASQDGTPLTAPASARVSVVLRGPEEVVDATIERFRGGSWQPLQTSPAGLGGMFLAVVTEFGDLALVEAGGAASTSPGEPTGSSAPSPPGGGTSPGGTGPGVPLWLAVVAGLALAGGAGALLVVTMGSGRRGGGRGATGTRAGYRSGDGRRGPVPRKGGGRQSGRQDGRQARPGRRR
jgi:hypothetical protein